MPAVTDHPILLEHAEWIAPSRWGVHIPFGMLLIDLLRPESILELGTAHGVSYCTFCQAIKSLYLPVRAYAIDTWEGDYAGISGDEVFANLHAYHNPRYGSFSTLIRRPFAAELSHFPDGSLDLIHWDGTPTYTDAHDTLTMWLPKLSRRGVLLFHGIQPQAGDQDGWRYWQELKHSYPYYEHNYGAGLGVLMVGEVERERLDWLSTLPTHERYFLAELFRHIGARYDAEQSLITVKRQLAGAVTPIHAAEELVLPESTQVTEQFAPESEPYADVYSAAAEIARGYGCTHVIVLGVGNGINAERFLRGFEIIGVDQPQVVTAYREAVRITWFAWDFNQPNPLLLPANVLQNALVLCVGLLDRVPQPEYVLQALRTMLDHVLVALITSADRDLAGGRWSLSDFRAMLDENGLRVAFSGYTRTNDSDSARNTLLAVLLNQSTPKIVPAPDDFRVVALLAFYNEEDVLDSVIQHLIGQGVEVYALDNWSTDNSGNIAESYLGSGVIAVEKFPSEGRGKYFAVKSLLRQKEFLGQTLSADWFIHSDADEIYESFDPNVSIRDALYWIQRCGFNVVNFARLEFVPTSDAFTANLPLQEQLSYWRFETIAAHQQSQRAWKKQIDQVDITTNGGHEVHFAGKRIAPFRFLLRHYPYRTIAQAKRKWQTRIHIPEESAMLWGYHHKIYAARGSVVVPSEQLTQFDSNFYANYLVERLTSVGISFDATPI